MEGLAVIRPKLWKMIGKRFVHDESTDIREGETGPTFDDMAALGVCLDAIRVDQGQGRGITGGAVRMSVDGGTFPLVGDIWGVTFRSRRS
jgi:hypothetical protein